MAVRRYLDASTAHITEQDDKLLREGVSGVIYYELSGGGYLIWVSPKEHPDMSAELDKQVKRAGLSDAFLGLIRYARQNWCDYIKLDGNGMKIEELPTFNW
jgi:hypothetical protein